jgi:L-rhamnose mutarotase
MQLKPGCRDEYERRHNPIWPELEAVLRSHGVHNYSIFFEQETDRLLAYCEIESVERWQEIAGTEVCRRWWTHMKDLMETNDDDSPRAQTLREVFHLD